MSAYPAWTPAPRPGIVPLHPYGMGTVLGRSFTALRQNPAVLLGFALGVQAVAYIVLVLAVGAIAFASFSRLETVPPGSEDFEAVLAGAVAVTALGTLALSLAAGALGVIVQGVVVTEVSHAVVAERRTLGALWRQVRPAAGRLVAYTLLLTLAALLAVALVGGALFALGTVLLPLAIVAGLLAVLAAIPLVLWLTTKLLLVPAVLILEGAGIGAAVARSWRLTRTRFWPTLGVVVTISLAFGVLAQIVGVPIQLLAMGLDTITNPTGADDASALVSILITGVLTQIVTLLIQCVALIVQSTATALIYVDCRMRHEGLDLDLAAYVERRDAGATDLPDPYRRHIGRSMPDRPPFPAPPLPRPAAGYPPPAPYPPAIVPPPPYVPPVSEPPAPPPASTTWTPPGRP